MLAHLVADLFVAQVRLDAQAALAGARYVLHRVYIALLRDRADDDLHGREPQRQMARVILQQDANEALHRAADRAVHHHRRRLLAVGRDVEGAEAFGQIEVDLRRAALPIAADRIAQHIFELRTVERALAG